MNIDLEILEKEAKRLGNIYGWAKSKSAMKKIANDLALFTSLYEDFGEDDNNLKWIDNSVIIDLLNDRHKYNLTNFVRTYMDELSFHEDSSRATMEAYKDTGFDFYDDCTFPNYQRINANLVNLLLNEFYSSLGKKCYDLFAKVFNNKQVLMPFATCANYGGVALRIEALNKTYITCGYKQFNVLSLVALVHEIGHAYEYMVGVNRYGGYEKFTTGMIEISSSFFEYAFIEFLIKNKYVLRDALKYKHYFLTQVFYNALMNNVVSDAINDESLIDINYNFLLDDIGWDILAQLCEEYNASSDEFCDVVPFRNAVLYGYGSLIAIHSYRKYLEDDKSFWKDFDNFLNSYGLIRNFGALDVLEISRTDLCNGEILRNEINSYNILAKKMHDAKVKTKK